MRYDLKDYRATPDWDSDDLGAFQILTRDAAAALLICLAIFALIFAPYIK